MFSKNKFDERIFFEKDVFEIISDLINSKNLEDRLNFLGFIPVSIKRFVFKLTNRNSKNCTLKLAFYKLYKVMVLDYVTWHRTIISRVKNNELNGTNVRTLVFIGSSRRHGLGDMLRGIIFSYISSVFSKRVFLIKGYCPFPLRELFENSEYSNFTYDEYYFPLFLNSSRIRGNAKIEKQELFSGNEAQVLIETESPPRFEALWENIGSEKYQNYSIASSLKLIKAELTKTGEELHVEEIYPFIYKGLFRMTEQVRRTIKDYVTEIGYSSVHNPYVSIHVRLGKGIGEGNIRRFKKNFKTFSVEQYADCLARKAVSFSYLLDINPPRFFLATDTPEFKNLFQDSVSKYDERSIVMHTSAKLKHVKKLEKSNQEDIDIIRSTFLELFLLSKGKGMIQSLSGFSHAARHMGGIKKYIIHTAYLCY